MHVRTKRIVFSGLLVSISVICMVLGSVIEMNTMFLLVLASYLVGVMIHEFGCMAGISGCIASIILGFIVAPNKFYVFTYAAMGIYIVLIEVLWRMLTKKAGNKSAKFYFLSAKYIVFNIMYVPILFFFPELIIGKEFPKAMLIGMILVGQLGLWIYDKAYEHFMKYIIKKIARFI